MQAAAYNLFGKALLPPCDGPKLQPFPDRKSPIEFLELLSLAPSESDPSGGHGHVFEGIPVEQRAQALIPVLKFKFYDPAQYHDDSITGWTENISDRILTFHSDPFFAECRAYGRINDKLYGGSLPGNRRGRSQKNQNAEAQKIAVPCYGYMALPAEKYEQFLSDEFNIRDWNRSEEDDEQGGDMRQPFRALVKEIVHSDRSIRNPATMLKSLHKLREWGIYPQDIYARNYKDGLLVDFGAAWTDPHWLLQTLEGPQLTIKKNNEFVLFDEMMEDAGINFSCNRAERNYDFREKLRSSGVPVKYTGLP